MARQETGNKSNDDSETNAVSPPWYTGKRRGVIAVWVGIVSVLALMSPTIVRQVVCVNKTRVKHGLFCLLELFSPLLDMLSTGRNVSGGFVKAKKHEIELMMEKMAMEKKCEVFSGWVEYYL